MEAGAGKGFHVAPQHALFPFCPWKSEFAPSPYQRVKLRCRLGGHEQHGAAGAWPRRWDRCCPPRHPAGPRPALPPGRVAAGLSCSLNTAHGQQVASLCAPSQCSGGLCSPWALRTLHMSSNPPTPCPQRSGASPLCATLGPDVAPGHSCITDLVSCRTVVTVAGGTHSVSPALPGGLRTAGATTAARPASPVPSSTASRSPTARRRPTPSAGSVCRGERRRSCGGDSGQGAGTPGAWDIRGALLTKGCLLEDTASDIKSPL